MCHMPACSHVLNVQCALFPQLSCVPCAHSYPVCSVPPQVSGIKFSFDPTQPPSHRVVPGSVFVGEKEEFEPLDLAKSYKVATKEYLAMGKDGYDVFLVSHAIPHTTGQPSSAPHICTTHLYHTSVPHICTIHTYVPHICTTHLYRMYLTSVPHIYSTWPSSLPRIYMPSLLPSLCIMPRHTLPCPYTTCAPCHALLRPAPYLRAVYSNALPCAALTCPALPCPVQKCPVLVDAENGVVIPTAIRNHLVRQGASRQMQAGNCGQAGRPHVMQHHP